MYDALLPHADPDLGRRWGARHELRIEAAHAVAAWLKERIRGAVGPGTVFVDPTESIIPSIADLTGAPRNVQLRRTSATAGCAERYRELKATLSDWQEQVGGVHCHATVECSFVREEAVVDGGRRVWATRARVRAFAGAVSCEWDVLLRSNLTRSAADTGDSEPAAA